MWGNFVKAVTSHPMPMMAGQPEMLKNKDNITVIRQGLEIHDIFIEISVSILHIEDCDYMTKFFIRVFLIMSGGDSYRRWTDKKN